MTWFWLGGSAGSVAADDSLELLRRLRMITRRPDTDRDLTNARAYTFLTDAQLELVINFSGHIPDILKGIPVQLSSSDGGETYTLPSEPLGQVEIYPAPFYEPLIEGPLWSPNADYVREGTRKIRMSQGRARTFPNGPWARYVVLPGTIDETHNATLVPNALRRVIPWKAAEMWAETGGLHDPAPYRKRQQAMLWGDPESPGDIGLIPAYKNQHFGTGLTESPFSGHWWRSRDLG